jgi:hypothetical protein
MAATEVTELEEKLSVYEYGACAHRVHAFHLHAGILVRDFPGCKWISMYTVPNQVQNVSAIEFQHLNLPCTTPCTMQAPLQPSFGMPSMAECIHPPGIVTL